MESIHERRVRQNSPGMQSRLTTHLLTAARRGRWASVLALAMLSLLGFAPSALAVPSMARQTGYQCSRCHTVFPELTPFGRLFKLGGYSMSSQKWEAKPWQERIPVSAALQVSQTSTSSTSAGGAMPEDFEWDRDPMLQTLAVYYGGKITQNSGALVQYNYDGVERRWAMEMLDIRYADSFEVKEKEVAYGLTLNNSPTVSDVYNSTPMWSFPHAGSAAPQMPAATIIDMTLASQVAGVTAYALWNDLIYAEAGAYRTAAHGAFRFVGAGEPTEIELTGTNPYWRLAYQKEYGKHSIEVGTYGMRSHVLADPSDPAAGSDRFEDYALDASYQLIDGAHTFSTHATWIHEKQRWVASFPLGLTSGESGSLTSFRVDAHFFFRRRWGGGIQYFLVSGSEDALRYDTGDVVMGSARASPDSKGWVAEANYLPADRIKIALRYTAYQEFNGASTNYMPGRDASDNDNVFVLGWILF